MLHKSLIMHLFFVNNQGSQGLSRDHPQVAACGWTCGPSAASLSAQALHHHHFFFQIFLLEESRDKAGWIE
jgi:hypothetical protein